MTKLSERVRRRDFHKRIQCAGGPQSYEDMLVDILANHISKLETENAELKKSNERLKAWHDDWKMTAETQDELLKSMEQQLSECQAENKRLLGDE